MTRKEVKGYVEELFYNNEIETYWELEQFESDFALKIDEALDEIDCGEVMEEIYGIFEDIPYDENLDDEKSIKKIESVFDNDNCRKISKAIEKTLDDWELEKFEQQYMCTHEL